MILSRRVTLWPFGWKYGHLVRDSNFVLSLYVTQYGMSTSGPLFEQVIWLQP